VHLAPEREEILGQAMERLVPARLRRLDEGERGVLIVGHAIQGIHHKYESHTLSEAFEDE
jgi:hypothetical protein